MKNTLLTKDRTADGESSLVASYNIRSEDRSGQFSDTGNPHKKQMNDSLNFQMNTVSKIHVHFCAI